MNRKTRLELFALMITVAISSTACQKANSSNNKIDDTASKISSETGIPKDKISDAINSMSNEADLNSQIKDEDTAIKYFTSSEEKLADIKDDDKNKYEEEATKYLKNVVDFVFYDKEVNGITFSNLKDKSKKEIIDSIERTNRIFENSGLKEIVIIGAKDAKEWTMDKIAVGTVVVKEIIGKDSFDKATDIASKIKKKLIEKAKDVKDAVDEYNSSK